VALTRGSAGGDAAGKGAVCTFGLANTGSRASGAAGKAAAYENADVYRLSVTAKGAGWSARLPSALATAKVGGHTAVNVAVAAGRHADRNGRVTLTARSASDPHKTATATCTVRR
jgi:hypothetical protein